MEGGEILQLRVKYEDISRGKNGAPSGRATDKREGPAYEGHEKLRGEKLIPRGDLKPEGKTAAMINLYSK